MGEAFRNCSGAKQVKGKLLLSPLVLPFQVTGRSFGEKDFRSGLENGILLCDCWFPSASFEPVHRGQFTAVPPFSANAFVMMQIQMWLKANRFYKVLPSLHPNSLVSYVK
uniref:Uncharacterized protein n=1 Tax=Nothoprocta perdicaria TaxID=30464 RepID=A0A8C6ZWT5_NOTPE